MEIGDEIKEAAQKLNAVVEKAQKNVAQDNLIKAIYILGSEGIKERLSGLEKAEKIILLNALEEMQKGTSMDKDYAAKYVQGKVYQDTVIQEDKADDDADEKLVKPENAKINHQGDQSDPNREENKVEDPKKDMKKGFTTTADTGYQLDENASKKEEEPAIKKGEDGVKNSEETQVKDDLEKLKSKKARGDKTRPEVLKVENENKAAQDKVDDLGQKGAVKKAIAWGEKNDLLKSNTQGRNHHFSINEYYDEAVQFVLDYKPGESLNKSEDTSINGMIEKGADASRDEVLLKAELAKQNKNQVTLVKSFSLDDIAHDLRISKSKQEEILKD